MVKNMLLVRVIISVIIDKGNNMMRNVTDKKCDMDRCMSIAQDLVSLSLLLLGIVTVSFAAISLVKLGWL